MSREGRLVLDKETLAFLPNRWCKDLYQPELCWKIFKRLCKTERSFSFKETLYKGVGVTEKTNHWEKSSIWKCFLVSVRKKRLLWEFQCLRGHLQWSYDHCWFFWRKLPIFLVIIHPGYIRSHKISLILFRCTTEEEILSMKGYACIWPNHHNVKFDSIPVLVENWKRSCSLLKYEVYGWITSWLK